MLVHNLYNICQKGGLTRNGNCLVGGTGGGLGQSVYGHGQLQCRAEIQLQFITRFKGYSEEFNEWLSENQLKNAPEPLELRKKEKEQL